MFKKFFVSLGILLLSYGVVFAQTDTTLNGLNLTGTAPSGYTAQPLRFGCLTSTYCWPYIQMYDGTTKGTFDPTTGGFKSYIVGGVPFSVSHNQTSALASSLVVKATSGSLIGFNCTAITGAAAGFCVVINAASAPTSGSAITPLDVCYFDTTSRGCSLGREPTEVVYSTGITVLVTTNASPLVYTSGVDTAFISADYQ